jgi:hypothetical protein
MTDLGAIVHTIAALARAAGPVPRYGDEAWLQLDTDDPRRLAAVYIAAECWRVHCLPATVAAEVQAQLDIEADTVRWRMRHGSWDLSDARDWRDIPASFAEVEAKRAG